MKKYQSMYQTSSENEQATISYADPALGQHVLKMAC